MRPVRIGASLVAIISVAAVVTDVIGVQSAAAQGDPAVEMRTLTYASRDGADLQLDLHLPRNASRPLPIVVFLHGGGWSGGTRTTGPDFGRFFARDGFAMASIAYRLTPSITFPSNVEDVRTAIRWLKANASAHGLDADRICLWGTSAGGHLAAVAGLAPPGTFEGPDNRDRTSAVRCVLDAYGPTQFDRMDAQTEQERPALQTPVVTIVMGPAGRAGAARGEGAGNRGAAAAARGRQGGPAPHDSPTSPESRLVGAPIQTVPDRVRAASPMTYITPAAPPFLIMHGLADGSVPHGQSVMLYDALKAAGHEVTLRLIDGLPHTFFNKTDLDDAAGPFRMDVREHPRGGPEQTRVERDGVFNVAREFFRKHLMQ